MSAPRSHGASAVGDLQGSEPVGPDADLRLPVRSAEASGGRAWQILAAISAGGVLGALGRYGVLELWPAGPTGFPVGMLAVNALGCALIGVLMVLVSERRKPVNPLVRPFLGVGVLGGFTSFSTYAADVSRLLDSGAAGVGVVYMAGTVVAALAAVWVSAVATRALVRRRHGIRPAGRPGAGDRPGERCGAGDRSGERCGAGDRSGERCAAGAGSSGDGCVRAGGCAAGAESPGGSAGVAGAEGSAGAGGVAGPGGATSASGVGRVAGAGGAGRAAGASGAGRAAGPGDAGPAAGAGGGSGAGGERS